MREKEVERDIERERERQHELLGREPKELLQIEKLGRKYPGDMSFIYKKTIVMQGFDHA